MHLTPLRPPRPTVSEFHPELPPDFLFLWNSISDIRFEDFRAKWLDPSMPNSRQPINTVETTKPERRSKRAREFPPTRQQFARLLQKKLRADAEGIPPWFEEYTRERTLRLWREEQWLIRQRKIEEEKERSSLPAWLSFYTWSWCRGSKPEREVAAEGVSMFED